MSYPSTFSVLPQPTASNRLNSPDHAALHNQVSSSVGQLEAVVGLADSGSVLGTLIGDLRSPNSAGGGHIQTAVKGGTGQVTYAKGDLLVGQSGSVLNKLSLGTTNQVLTVDTTQQLGIVWGTPATTKVAVNTTSVSAAAGAASVRTLLFAASVAGSVLGTSGAVRFNGLIRNFTAASEFFLEANYGNSQFAFTTVTSTTTATSTIGTVSGAVLSRGSTSTQLAYITFDTGAAKITTFATTSVQSDAPQELLIKGNFTAVNSANSILTGGFVVDKIV